MSARTYLFAVQDSSGRELCSVTETVERVGEVEVERRAALVRICRGDKVLVAAQVPDGPAGEHLSFHRWFLSNKLAKPVTRKVKSPE